MSDPYKKEERKTMILMWIVEAVIAAALGASIWGLVSQDDKAAFIAVSCVLGAFFIASTIILVSYMIHGLKERKE